MPHKPTFHRYRDLTPATINVEYQVHTSRTDGEAEPHVVLDAAMERGLSAIAFTEHVRKDTGWFAAFAAEIRGLAPRYAGMAVYVGCETKVLDEDGTLDVSQTILDSCDIVLGSVHRVPKPGGGYYDFSALAPADFAELEFNHAMAMVRHAPIDVLAHPGGMYERRHGAFPPELFRRMMMATLDRGIAIEINSSYLVDRDGFLALCEEINPIVSIGSDAHKLVELGRCRDAVLARRGAAS